ncbi:MAG: BrnA antitoxin family protein [Pseudomonadota bacterium]|nr:BrnA antitoxin family protein [Pseudomonadota bacterium]
MTKRHDPTRTDAENPEWTSADFAKAKPASKALPRLIGKTATNELMAKSKRGRGPQKVPTKELVTLRLDQEVLDWFREQGPRWQTRINQTLKNHIHHRHSP